MQTQMSSHPGSPFRFKTLRSVHSHVPIILWYRHWREIVQTTDSSVVVDPINDTTVALETDSALEE